MSATRKAIERWFDERRWRVFDFQREAWDAIAAGHDGLLHASTGAGKTYAVWLGALARFAALDASGGKTPAPIRVVWLTPMRALAADTTKALAAPLAEIAPHWTVGVRTGDTGSAERARQARRLPSALVTTPESLSLFLTHPDWRERFASLSMVIVDEWHELVASKRGVQAQLALARLRGLNPALQTWGLSATLGDLAHARDTLIPPERHAVLIRGEADKTLAIDTLIPPRIDRFPWAGHLGAQMLPQVVAEIESSASTLLFTNTRSQSEQWYQALLDARPDWAGLIALHHGSLDHAARDWVEGGLKSGALKAVVCTSSLDLGVDFLPVERVLQLGSPKGVARLLQRAGRSGHSPGRVSRVTCVPTHALELIEAAAARRAANAGRIEARRSPVKPFDVLVQHLVSAALGGGFEPEAMLAELRGTFAYRNLTDADFRWALGFVVGAETALAAYPEHRRVVRSADGLYRVEDKQIARRHRMSVGTIVADAAMEVRFTTGGRLGSIEESFIAMLARGDRFLFAGRTLELVRVHEMTAYVRLAQSKRYAVPRWAGGRMPLSSELARAVVELIDVARDDMNVEPEIAALAPLLAVQAKWSAIPGADELLVEEIATREGHHVFFYPFGGRSVHTGLANLFAWRATRTRPMSFSISANDYGFEMLSPEPIDWRALAAAGLFDAADLEAHVQASLNESELARRRFREIARVSGLVQQGFPGQSKSARQLQASSGLFFDVFAKYDPGNLLLAQAHREALEQELERMRLEATLAAMRTRRLVGMRPPRPTPFAFPLMVDRTRDRYSNEQLAERVARMVADLESAAESAAARPRNPSRARSEA